MATLVLSQLSGRTVAMTASGPMRSANAWPRFDDRADAFLSTNTHNLDINRGFAISRDERRQRLGMHDATRRHTVVACKGTEPRSRHCRNGWDLEASMPRYFFNVSNTIEHRDLHGMRLADESAARGHARRMASNLAARLPPSVLPLKLIVTNENGDSLCEEEISVDGPRAGASRRCRQAACA
jgi:hypothetical protein